MPDDLFIFSMNGEYNHVNSNSEAIDLPTKSYVGGEPEWPCVVKYQGKWLQDKAHEVAMDDDSDDEGSETSSNCGDCDDVHGCLACVHFIKRGRFTAEDFDDLTEDQWKTFHHIIEDFLQDVKDGEWDGISYGNDSMDEDEEDEEDMSEDEPLSPVKGVNYDSTELRRTRR